jgi:hypothetical protein
MEDSEGSLNRKLELLEKDPAAQRLERLLEQTSDDRLDVFDDAFQATVREEKREKP